MCDTVLAHLQLLLTAFQLSILYSSKQHKAEGRMIDSPTLKVTRWHSIKFPLFRLSLMAFYGKFVLGMMCLFHFGPSLRSSGKKVLSGASPSVRPWRSLNNYTVFRIFMKFSVGVLFKCRAILSIVKICSVTAILYLKGVIVSAHANIRGLQTPGD